MGKKKSTAVVAATQEEDTEEDDPWSIALTEHLQRIRDNIGPGFEEWFAAMDKSSAGELEGKELAQQLQDAARSVSPSTNIIEWRRVVTDIERWFVSEHNERIKMFVQAVAEREPELKVNLREFLLPQSSWLRELTKGRLDELRDALTEMKDAMTRLADEVYESSGFGGLMRGLYRGFTNPDEGIKSFWSGDTWTKEFQQLYSSYESALQRLGEQQEELIHELNSAVCDRWNQESIATFNEAADKVDALLDEIEARNEQQPEQLNLPEPPPVSSPSTAQVAPYKTSEHLLGYVIMFLLMLIAGGVGWWLAKT